MIITNLGRFSGRCCIQSFNSEAIDALIEPLKKILFQTVPTDFASFDATLSEVKCDFNMEPVLRSLSIACCKAAARHKGLSVYSFVSQLAGESEMCIAQPIATLLVLTNDKNHLTSLQVLASQATSIEIALETLRSAAEAVYKHLPKLRESIRGLRYGAVCIAKLPIEEAIRFIIGTLKEEQLLDSGLALYIDMHSSRRLSDRASLLYDFESQTQTGAEMCSFAYNLWRDFEVISIEDPTLFSDPSPSSILTVMLPPLNETDNNIRNPLL